MSKLKLTALINIGPYSHVTAEYEVDTLNTGTALCDIRAWKKEIEDVMQGSVYKEEIKNDKIGTSTRSDTKSEESNTTAPAESKQDSKTEDKAPKRTRAKKDEVKDTFEGQAIPEVIKEEKKIKELVIPYTRSLEAHKNILSSYLSNTFPGWKSAKPREEIIAFTASLEGNSFLNAEGNIVDSFKEILAAFFNV